MKAHPSNQNASDFLIKYEVYGLILSLSSLPEKTGNVLTFNFNPRWEDLAQRVHGLKFVEPINVCGEAFRRDDGIFVSGQIATEMLTNCDRCLCDMTVKIDLQFFAAFCREGEQVFDDDSPDADDYDFYTYSGDQIDLTDMIQDEILISLPRQSLCADECKGLCPICGANLNEKPCSCETQRDSEESNSPFSLLHDLIIDDEEVL